MDESRRSIHHRLLESGHHKLNQQFQLMQEKTSTNEASTTSDSERMTSFPAWGPFSDTYFFGSPYRSVLENMGHAVHVSRAGSGEIIYLNGAAEQLYGYKDDEAFGQSVVELLFDEEHRPSVLAIMGGLTAAGESWSGQLPVKNRSGQSFLAIVCKSPLHEDGELVGIVTVSCDASVFNNTVSENTTTTHQNHADERKSKFRGINFKKIQPQVVALPEFQSISNLASKVLMRKRASEEGEVESQDVRADKPPRVPIAAFGWNIGKNRNERMSSEKEELSTSLFAQPPKIAVKLLSKLQIGAMSNSENEKNQQNGSEDNTTTVDCEDASPRLPSSRNIPIPAKNFGSGTQSSSSKGNIDSKNVVVNSDIRWEDLKLKEEIGNGSFAVVYRGVWNGSDVAVKAYHGSQYSEAILLDYKKEIGIMKKLRHPNVLLYMGAVCSEVKLAIVTEYLARGSLFRILHRGNQTLDMGRRLKMAIDVARGMNYLHHMNPPIVHRDLKSSNLLVDKSWTVKVGDFGLSKMKYATFLTAKSGRGTPQWMAPEVLRNEPSTEKSDIFSFGVILWELMTERIPWSDINALQVVGVVGFMNGKLEIPENIDPRVSTIISDCWQRNPDERPSFEDIMHKMMDLVASKSASTPSTP